MNQSVCIGFAEALSAPEVAWSLVDAGYRVTAFGRRGRCSSLRHSKYVRVVEITAPEKDCGTALSELHALLTSLTVPGEQQVLMPLDDAAVWLSGQMEIPSGWVCAGAGRQLVHVALDKSFQLRTAEAAGFAVPNTVVATTIEEVLSKVKRFPLIMRPAHAVRQEGPRLTGGRNRTCASQAELEHALRQWNAGYPVLVQPFIQGTGEGVFGLACNDGIKAWSAHRRIRMVNPKGSGSSACASSDVTSDLREPIENFISQTKWRGIFMVELLRDEAGTAWFVEFNGRAWGSMALQRRRGLEYPAWNVKLATCPGWAGAIPGQEPKHIVCRHFGRECAHLLFVLRGPRSSTYRRWPSFWRTLLDVLSIRKQDSFYNWRQDDKAVFFTDWWYTVRQTITRGLGR
jgi:predicted ATP-grasp superfamily ATP-dependent carboligase